uniref:Uncharacterized protein n=1 Tax=Anopheles quadriannulatus TaxID=34691 RepID=A0A182XS24_ANOQN
MLPSKRPKRLDCCSLTFSLSLSILISLFFLLCFIAMCYSVLSFLLNYLFVCFSFASSPSIDKVAESTSRDFCFSLFLSPFFTLFFFFLRSESLAL